MHHHHQHHHQRRRKKRPNYGTRTVELSRGCNGFGFTISGQQPCILSCIVANSPADQAGLRAGDFLISVNGLNVSKLPHEMVVQLIGNSLGTICMQIAENYFSDSSDEENAVSIINRIKPRYLHHKLKMNRMKSLPQKTNENQNVINDKSTSSSFHPVIEDAPFSIAHNIIHSPNASTSKDISNVSAMVKKTDESSSVDINLSFNGSVNGANSLEYRVIVGYLGTIEMPKQIATSSKLQTVQSCIRKMRQEKRNSITVLMTILPNCLIIRNSNASILATYPSSRLSYVSSSTESENRFFGLVTSAIFANTDDDPTSIDNIDREIVRENSREVITSNSCHVFVIDTKICDHTVHQQKAIEFKISCTKDPISNLCLEFPNNSEYVVNLIRSMYTMNVLSSCTRQVTSFSKHQCGMYNDVHDPLLQANSPQPSNHSEITTSSNSDSGIGFHNDCTNISDRILVVEFPTIMMNRMNGNKMQYRPQTVCNHIENHPNKSPLSSDRFCKLNKNDVNTRLTVRAMPDPKSTLLSPSQKHNIPDLLANFNNSNISTPLSSTRSCDDVITSVERDEFISKRKKQLQMSMDDITMLASSGNSNGLFKKQHVFVQPCKPAKKARKNSTKFKNDHNNCENKSKLAIYKLSPKVFGISRSDATNTSIESLFHKSKKNCKHVKQDGHLFDIWGSLQNLNKNSDFERNTISFLKETYSEPDLVSRALPSTSPLFRRWGQSSFRSSKQIHSRIPLLRKLSPALAASEINVYSKTMDEFVNDLNSQCIHDTSLSGGDTDSQHNQNSSEFNKENDNQSSAVINWSTSFEKLLEDSSGLHTFAEFLKKEFSAENIYFWTACERYRQIDSDELRATLALEIYSKHLASKASEPVNVDSQARNITEESLKTANKNLFIQAQKQIFNLMKFDSYQRFIRSDLYKKCLEAESKNQPLPYPGNQLDELLKTKLNSPGPSKLKKSTSNAEDRRRKSLLPWHRKTRCKSRDRNEYGDGGTSSSNKSSEKFSENSLKLPIKNSINDIHSSRSSLSSFDATTVSASGYCGSDDLKSCSLCRVLICDGVTTIVQIRSDETIKQLIDRLLEKRGIHYQYFDVILSDQLKSIDIESSATYLAGKEVQIEQRVAFKLHLPDPKVISVKSKPKKVLYEVLKPILYKYNYHLDNVQVLIKDTHEKLNVSVPVTEIDGQRLQIVLSKSEDCKRDLSHIQKQSKINHESLIQSSLYKNQLNSKIVLPTSSSKSVKPVTQQTTLDEITNKVFNELLQGKVESHSNQISLPKVFDHSSIKSDDCISESSSLFERFCYRDSNILVEGLKGLKPRKLNVGIQQPSTSKNLTRSQDGLSISTQATNENDSITNYMKKPLIAKWKTGVKLQVPGKTEHHDEFLEGLKRAQRARLEDQRGTEINSELPDFLKDKRKSNASSNKLDKIWYNLSPVERLNPPKIPLTMPSLSSSSTSSSNGLSITDIKNNFENRLGEKPQPAPRLSITKDNHSSVVVNNNIVISPPPSVKIEIQELNSSLDDDDDQHCESNVEQNNYSCNSNDDDGGGGILNNNDINDVTCNNEFEIDLSSKEPPPLPPKPKVLPIKPSNWGHGLNNGNNNNNNLTASSSPLDNIGRRHANNKTIEKKSIDRNVYLDQPSSSFV